MSKNSNENAPHSRENLNEEDFYNALKGVSASKADSKKAKNEYGHWSTLLYDSVEEMVKNLKRLNILRKTILPLTFVRFCIEFEKASIYDTANMTKSPFKQLEKIRIKLIDLAEGDRLLILSFRGKRQGLNTINRDEFNKRQCYKCLNMN